MCEGLGLDHQTYFNEQIPGILKNFIECIEAIRFLHEHGEKHGDIRRDHILIDRHSGRYRWIDFDFNYRHRENIYGYDLFGIGNILVFLAGKGDVLVPELKKQGHPALHKLTDEDVNIVFHNRVANLKKIYPYIPESLNRVLMHFSKGANWFYENTVQLLDDLGSVTGHPSEHGSRLRLCDLRRPKMINIEEIFNKNIMIAVDESENASRAVSYVGRLLAGIGGFNDFDPARHSST
jgi:hypothetical protein